MTGEQLKKSILKHAIEGKLVPQNPADEPAEELLEHIREEKRRLLKEGKLKKYTEACIYKDEAGKWRERVAGKSEDEEVAVPFELPAGWAWARLETVSWLVNPPKAQGEELPYLDAKTLRGKAEKAYLTEGRVVDAGAKVILVDGENSGEVFAISFRGYMGSTFRVLESAPQVDMDYIILILNYYKGTFRDNKTGTAIPHLNKNLFKSLLIGLPPLAEQRRIAERVAALFEQIAVIDKGATSLERLFAGFKKRALTLAVQGKLCKQDPADEPAEALLKRIRAEKRKLVKEGKIKKYAEACIYKGEDGKWRERVAGKKQDAEIDVPFELPAGWAWARLGEFIRIIGGVSYSKPDVAKSGIRILRGGNINDLKITLFPDDVFLPKAYYDAEKQVQKDDILIAASTGSKAVIGKAGYVLEEMPDTQIGAFLRIVRTIDKSCVPYIKLIFATEYYRNHIRDVVCGTNINNIRTDHITDLLVPIPPLAEQKRIVAKVAALFAAIDSASAEQAEQAH